MGHIKDPTRDETEDQVIDRLSTHYDHLDSALSPELSIAVCNRLRDEPGVPHTDARGGYYLITHYKDVIEAQRSSGARCPVFSYAGGILQPQNDRPRGIPIDFDEPEHGEYRKLFMNIMNKAAVQRFDGPLREEIAKVVDDFIAEGSGNFSADVARRLPIAVVGRLIGWSDEASADAQELVEAMMIGLETEGRPPAQTELLRLLQCEVDQRRAEPRDDYLTEMLGAVVNGHLITDAELANTLLTFLFGGYESTATVVGYLMIHLARDLELQERLRADPSLIPAAIEEMLRLRPVVHVQFRTVTADVEMQGTTLPEGSRVGIAWAGANHDPDQFEDPEAFRLDRPNGRSHVGWGFGVHLCAGIHLARVEMTYLFESLLASGRRFELEAEPVHGGFVIGHDSGWSDIPIRCVPI